ncbi:hypothetical protein EYV94_22060 [Puteibacter caeruleilacunae]|nr:hypothetical protein EYV94_22060 [Puteibacter caeruleilacunae]
MDAPYILYNGNIYPTTEKLISPIEHIDSLHMVEFMHSAENKIHFFKEHLHKIRLTFHLLGMTLPDYLKGNGNFLHRELTRLINKNKLYMGAGIQLHIAPEFRIAQTIAFPEREYVLNKGILTDTYEHFLKPIHPLSSIYQGSFHFWQLARFHADKNYDELIFVNEENKICEGYGKNIFLIRDNKLYTPPLSSGCYHDILREKVLLAAKSVGIDIEQNIQLDIKDLLMADEVFFARAYDGITWMKGIRARRYYNVKTKLILRQLNTIMTA